MDVLGDTVYILRMTVLDAVMDVGGNNPGVGLSWVDLSRVESGWVRNFCGLSGLSLRVGRLMFQFRR